MATVTSTATRTVPATPDAVVAALADYDTVRPAILPEQYTDYAVESGGVGNGTVVTWRLHATEKRVRHVVADVVTSSASVTETDRSSTLVTVYRATAEGSGTRVDVTTTWQGAGGIGGFFEKTFAPKGLQRIHDALLDNLAARLSG